jgi:O-antigen ligase
MRHVPAAIAFLLPLAIAPGWFFYYDVTPKAAVVLVGLAALALAAAWKPETTSVFMTSPWGRWNIALAGLAAMAAIASAGLSQYPSLAWHGSSWRRWGAILQIATLAAAVLAAAAAQSRIGLLRAISAAGLLASVYAALQYFGWDPWLDAAAYHFGEGERQIVRPPGTMGHSNYLAAFLLWPAFAGAALWSAEAAPAGRWFGAITAAGAAGAVVLCGSRGALLGLLAGGAVLTWLRRPRLRSLATGLAACAAALVLFYVSPAGERLRARVFWAGEDSAGGARLLLWRDTLRMAAGRLAAGSGPDTFAAVFPQHQSADLARAYPDFYHESPHNIFLDALAEQGLPGLAALVALTALGLAAGWRALRGERRALAGPLLAGLAAALVAQQFIVFIIPTAFFFFLAIALLCGMRDPAGRPPPARWVLRLAGGAIAAGALAAAFPLVSADHRLATVRNELDAGRAARAAGLWRSSRPLGTADVYFSRRFAQAALAEATPAVKLELAQTAGLAAARATQNPEQRHNAFYNLATIQAAADDLAAVEASLRGAIAASPAWYKPHWALARALHLAGRQEEARAEAAKALDLNGRRDPEVVATMEEILRSPASVR